MRIVCWITKATNTHSEYIRRSAFSTATMVTRTRLTVTSYVLYLSRFFTLSSLSVFSIMHLPKSQYKCDLSVTLVRVMFFFSSPDSDTSLYSTHKRAEGLSQLAYGHSLEINRSFIYVYETGCLETQSGAIIQGVSFILSTNAEKVSQRNRASTGPCLTAAVFIDVTGLYCLKSG
jgi:hypothetical protein